VSSVTVKFAKILPRFEKRLVKILKNKASFRARHMVIYAELLILISRSLVNLATFHAQHMVICQDYTLPLPCRVKVNYHVVIGTEL